MNREELIELHKETCARCVEIMQSKNHDYTGDGDIFKNFKAADVFGIDPVRGLLLRVMDKLQRINTFAEKGKLEVENESVIDAFEDVINYMILGKAMVVEQNEAEEIPSPYTEKIFICEAEEEYNPTVGDWVGLRNEGKTLGRIMEMSSDQKIAWIEGRAGHYLTEKLMVV
jgi:hypothetical protein